MNFQSTKQNLILSCNIRSIFKNCDHLLASKVASQAQLLCLQETWVAPSSNTSISLNRWIQHSNSVGRGKGISNLFKSPFKWISDVKKNDYQLTKIASETVDVINVYRSSGANSNLFLGDLHRIIAKRRTIIVGDFNLCYLSDNSHPIFESLREYGFHQLVEFPTHDKGRMIDLTFEDRG